MARRSKVAHWRICWLLRSNGNPLDDLPDNSLGSVLNPTLYIDVYDNDLSSTPLYDGASITVMDALVQNFSWFSEHPGISHEALSDKLRMDHYEVLPPGNKLPSSYSSATIWHSKSIQNYSSSWTASKH